MDSLQIAGGLQGPPPSVSPEPHRTLTTHELARLQAANHQLHARRRDAAPAPVKPDHHLLALLRTIPVPGAATESSAPLHPTVQAAVQGAALRFVPRQTLTPLHQRALELRGAAQGVLAARLRQAGLLGTRGVLRRDRAARNLKVYAFLALSAMTYLESQGVQPHARAGSATLFAVLDLLPTLLDMGHSTVEAALSDLRQAGLLASQRQYATVTLKDQEVRAVTGTWICVNLNPAGEARPYVHWPELPACPRDLTLDRQVGRTAYQLRRSWPGAGKVGESETSENLSERVKVFLSFSVKVDPTGLSVKKDSPTSGWSVMDGVRQAVYQAHHAHPRARYQLVGEAASAIARTLQDPGAASHAAYCQLLWQAFDAEHQSFPALTGLLESIEVTLRSVAACLREGRPIRRPGAYLRAKLRGNGLLGRLASTASPGSRLAR